MDLFNYPHFDKLEQLSTGMELLDRNQRPLEQNQRLSMGWSPSIAITAFDGDGAPCLQSTAFDWDGAPRSQSAFDGDGAPLAQAFDWDEAPRSQSTAFDGDGAPRSL